MNVSEFLSSWRPDETVPYPRHIQQSIALARWLQQRSQQLQTGVERRQQAELDRIIRDPHDRATLTQLTDQAFRAKAADRAADQLVHILDVQGIPRFFSPLDQTLMRGFQSFGAYLPDVAIPLVQDKMRRETANVILPAEPELLHAYLQERRKANIRINVNFLGEALLGEADAQRRLKSYLQALQSPDIEVISIKISTIFSQISALARQHTIDVLCDRLELLYRAAGRESFLLPNGQSVSKFVYLDMEEYRDVHLTAQVMMQTLDRPGLQHIHAGIALQAYLPDSCDIQQSIYAWARRRVAAGGSPITVRLVKGANMEMERVDASIHGWQQAPYRTKVETDANFKRMLGTALQPANLSAARLAVASHNLFDVAYAIVLAWETHSMQHVQLEMLEGMANPQRRALSEVAQDILLYAPACRREEFLHAVGYLIRRLDENSGPENFLRYAFRLQVDSPEWLALQQLFVDSWEIMESVCRIPRRTQDRRDTSQHIAPLPHRWEEFENEPDTDFSLPHHSQWAETILDDWRPRCGAGAMSVPVVVDGQEHFDRPQLQINSDPSQPGVIVSRCALADERDVNRAVSCAQADIDGWRRATPQFRRNILDRVAQTIAEQRSDLMGAALAETGKLLQESDPEVSEAVDFVRFYGRTAEQFHGLPTIKAHGMGVIAVVSPWNFPLAIPCGGMAAALAAGNCVILKPSSNAILVGYKLCECFWQSGISRHTLQFLPCDGNNTAQKLVTHDGVQAVVLTGGTATALSMLDRSPRLNLIAETGGKNATIVTAMADRDQAIKNVVHSAFGHSGQKCSATSLLILEQEVYDDATFRATLCDAVASRAVGSAWDLATSIGPLIHPPVGPLERGLKELEPGESWALLPRISEQNRQLVAPGIKWDVRPGSYTHMTEFFGPLLAVMPARNLREAISLSHQTGYGLTAGLESLDDREQQLWQELTLAGNLYLNRPTTGAIVLRQPFGGWSKSAFGPGLKAGGPNYVVSLMHFETVAESQQGSPLTNTELATLAEELLRPHASVARIPVAERRSVVEALSSYDQISKSEFDHRHDYCRLLGQDNFLGYRPFHEIRIRLDIADTFFDIISRVGAARSLGCRTTISAPLEFDCPALQFLDEITQPWGAHVELVEETDEQLVDVLLNRQTDRLRYSSHAVVPESILRAAAQAGVYVARAPVLPAGRVELLWYLREQSISMNYHRYGNLGTRAAEFRRERA